MEPAIYIIGAWLLGILSGLVAVEFASREPDPDVDA